MMNSQSTNPMKTIYDVTTNIFLMLKSHLSDEINSNGGCFTLKKQVNYAKYYDELLKLHLFEKVKSGSNDRTQMKVGVIQVLCSTQEYIELYQKNKELFYSYDREQIAFEKYMELNKSFSGDRTDLLFMFHQERYFECDKYYTQTEFYKKVGVLLENYHELFYVYCKHFQNQIRTREYDEGQTNEVLLIKNTNFIENSLLHFVYIKLSDILFDEVSEEDFIRFFNLKNDFIKVKIKDGQKSKVCSLIGLLHKIIKSKLDSKLCDIWLENILKSLELKRNLYDSKYSNYIKSDDKETKVKKNEEMKGDNLIYYEKLNTLFDAYNKLNEI